MAESSVETLRAAADRVWTGTDPHPWAAVDPDAARALAYWLEGAALAAVEIGPDHRAVAFARVLLGVPDGR